MSDLKESIKNLPAKPGVYLFKNTKNQVIYIGKAKSLKDRVSSYLDLSMLELRIAAMVKQANDLDFIVTDTPNEALLLENSLIKELQPYYNIKLRDDKEYSYLVITKETFPRLYKTRRLITSNAHYFGPFTNSGALSSNIKTIRNYFPIRICKYELPGKNIKPCLDYHIGLCSAPCTGLASPEEYKSMVADVLLLLSGRYKKLEDTLKKKMLEASDELKFEEAARLRESLKHLENIISKQRVVTPQPVDRDVFGVVTQDTRACVEYIKIRSGRLILDMQMFAGSEDLATPQEFLGVVMQQIYGTQSGLDLPTEILVSVKPSIEDDILEFINEAKRLQKPVRIIEPKRGDKVALVEMAITNAKHHLSEHLRREALSLGKNAVIELQKQLALKKPPIVIEGFDIANIQGKSAVGSQVSFVNGRPNKKGYRLYKIKTKDTPDDYAMIREVLERRRTHWDDDEFAEKPNLLLIDGGLGQLNVALDVFKGLDVEIASIAKEEELLLRHGMEPIKLPIVNIALRLVQQVRDESHRFAGKHFRKVHNKLSGLDKVV